MKSQIIILVIFLMFSNLITSQKKLDKNKTHLIKSVEFHEKELIKISDAIWVKC